MKKDIQHSGDDYYRQDRKSILSEAMSVNEWDDEFTGTAGDVEERNSLLGLLDSVRSLYSTDPDRFEGGDPEHSDPDTEK